MAIRFGRQGPRKEKVSIRRLLVSLFWYSLLFTRAMPTCAFDHPKEAQVRHTARGWEVITSSLRLEYDRKTGFWKGQWPPAGRNRTPVFLRGVSAAVTFADGGEATLADYPRHETNQGDVLTIKDRFGPGTQITVHHRGALGKPDLRQIFRVYSGLSYFLMRVDVVSPAAPVTVSNVTPLLLDSATVPDAGLFLDSGDTPCTLSVPYDNDAWVRYHSRSSQSCECTAIYDNASRHGFVLGSVTHDLWKTGITLGDPAPRRLGTVRVRAGSAGKATHDSQLHGMVTGRTVQSPLILVGYFSDWRQGMEAYAHAHARLRPPLPWTGDGGVPFGWNSWAAWKDKITFEGYLAASDFVKDTLQPHGFGDKRGDVYINLDSFWDNLTDAQITDAVRHVHANGQKAGIYWTPFVCWGGDLNRPVEGTGGRFMYRDILLKDDQGKPLPTLDGGMPIDPTHPGSLLRIDAQLDRFVAWGFDFVKLDFLTHGALEGRHHDRSIMTGTAAYNMGMRRIVADLDPKRIGRPFFISLSISPLFPSGYGHSRRISCDAAGGVGATEYMLNSLTYGWWQQDGLYRFNDPDHTVLYQERGQEPVTETEARSRLIASVIAGGMLLDSDDLTQTAAKDRAASLLIRSEIHTLARSGRSFRPVEADTGERAADTFVWTDPASRTAYVALFNFSRTEKRAGRVDLARLGLTAATTYTTYDLWNRQVGQVSGALLVDLPPRDAILLRLSSDSD